MGVPYKFLYRVGFHPWEDLAEHPPFAEKLTELFEREESGREPPYGPALDLGCGSGVWGGHWQSEAGRSRELTSWTRRSSAPARGLERLVSICGSCMAM
jgi:hypothetical protein